MPLVLHYWEGAAHAEAAARLGCSVATLNRRLDAARERLGIARFNGKSLFGTRDTLVHDFFAFPDDAQTLRNVIFAAHGDINGDGFSGDKLTQIMCMSECTSIPAAWLSSRNQPDPSSPAGPALRLLLELAWAQHRWCALVGFSGRLGERLLVLDRAREMSWYCALGWCIHRQRVGCECADRVVAADVRGVPVNHDGRSRPTRLPLASSGGGIDRISTLLVASRGQIVI